MQTYTPEDLSVLNQVAKSYAVSDNYHAASPTQTWPNRAFMHAGTSQGNVNNKPYLPYDCKTIFNVFEEQETKVSWKVYKSSEIIPSLTRLQMTKLWDPFLSDHFQHVSEFIEQVKTGKDLPSYSFIEPSFVVEDGVNATSEHPPANVCAGDHFLEKIINAVTCSEVFDDILFIINFDENGGCPDHESPHWGAVSPDKESDPGKAGFKFNRYGVRVPAIFISPYIKEQTCIRANEFPFDWDKQEKPFDHTSILAMLLDWKNIKREELPSARVQKAPVKILDNLLSDTLRADRPQFSAICKFTKQSFWKRIYYSIKHFFGYCAPGHTLSSLQKSIIIADLHYRTAKADNFKSDVFANTQDVDNLLSQIKSEKEMMAHFSKLYKNPTS